MPDFQRLTKLIVKHALGKRELVERQLRTFPASLVDFQFKRMFKCQHGLKGIEPLIPPWYDGLELRVTDLIDVLDWILPRYWEKMKSEHGREYSRTAGLPGRAGADGRL